MARRAGCGVAVKGYVIDGCYATYTTSVTPVGVPASSPRQEPPSAVALRNAPAGAVLKEKPWALPHQKCKQQFININKEQTL